jgi:hypothetical protein
MLAEVTAHLAAFLGAGRKVSLTDRHESNGVERVNFEVIRHLTALVNDARYLDRWADDDMLPLVEYIINSSEHSESGLTPFEATFGSHVATYFRMPAQLEDKERTHTFVRLLDENLRTLREISQIHQSQIKEARLAKTPEEKQNQFCPGDFILFKPKTVESKLTCQYSGPYEVISQYKNDITCRHCAQGTAPILHVENVKLFIGTREQAFAAAQRDCDQYRINKIIAFKGSIDQRTGLTFKIVFEDGDIRWVPYSRDSHLYDDQV